MSTTHTGLDIPTAQGVPAGATIERVYWTVPQHYTSGPEFDTQAEAIAAGIAERAAAIERDVAARAERGERSFVPERFSIDLRWKMQFPSGGLDLPVARTTYETLDDAREHLARIEKFSGR